jgi:hypothetical protein
MLTGCRFRIIQNENYFVNSFNKISSPGCNKVAWLLQAHFKIKKAYSAGVPVAAGPAAVGRGPLILADEELFVGA